MKYDILVSYGLNSHRIVQTVDDLAQAQRIVAARNRAEMSRAVENGLRIEEAKWSYAESAET